MSISFFGILWLLLLLSCLFDKTPNKMLLILLVGMTLQGSTVIEVGGTSIGPQIVTSCFFCIYCLTQKRENVFRINKYTIPVMIYLLFLIYMYIYRDEETNVMVLVQLLFYLLCAASLYGLKIKINENIYLNLIKKLSLFTLAICAFQFVCSAGLFPKDPLRLLLLNKDAGDAQFARSDHIYRVFGTFLEPSYCSTLLVGLIMFFLGSNILNKKDRKFNILLYALLCSLILTFSTTGYVSLMLVLFMYFVLQRNKLALKKYIPVLLLISLFVIIFWNTVIMDVIINKMEGSSGVNRASWNDAAIIAFMNNPIYGAGFGTTRASSFILCILAETGIVGCTMYVLFSIFLYYPLLYHKRIRFGSMELGARFFTLSVFVGMCIACPDQTMCTFWMGMYLIILASKTKSLRLLDY